MKQTEQVAMTPEGALDVLLEGNQRFVAGETTSRDWPAEVKEYADGQYPFAAVVSCLDSRIPVEVVFDQGISDIFVARIAGNFVNDDILGSLEFAGMVGVKLILILGHTGCGAVNGAIQKVDSGLLTTTLANINPAVESVKAEGGSESDDDFAYRVTVRNVQLTMEKLHTRSINLRAAIDKGDIKLAGAIYDIKTGVVSTISNG